MAQRGALQTPYEDAVASPGLARDGGGTSGGVTVPVAGGHVVQTPYSNAEATPGARETVNSMSGVPPQNTFEEPEQPPTGAPGGGETELPFAQLEPAGRSGRTL